VDSRDGRAIGTQIHVRLPDELVLLLDVYQISTRMVSRGDALRRLLETHPDLLVLALRVYDVGKSTSPP
jgi:hypothetical protein